MVSLTQLHDGIPVSSRGCNAKTVKTHCQLFKESMSQFQPDIEISING